MKKVDLPRPLAFWVCLTASVLLLVGSCFVPPMGVIDGSILAAVGELFAFAALGVAWKGLQAGMSAKVTHGQTTIAIGDDDDDVEPPTNE